MAVDLGLAVMYLDDLARQIRDEVPVAKLPIEDTHGLFRLYAVLMLSLGVEVRCEDVHNAWVAWMSERDPDHEALVPFGELTPEVAQEDAPYVEAIRRVAGRSESHTTL